MARLRACWVTHAESGWAVTPAMWTRLVESSMKNSTKSVLSITVSTVKKSVARMPDAWVRRNARQFGSGPREAGPSPERRRIERIVVAPMRIPSLRSSPWMRRHPQRRFSRPSRRIRARISGSVWGRPGLPLLL